MSANNGALTHRSPPTLNSLWPLARNSRMQPPVSQLLPAGIACLIRGGKTIEGWAGLTPADSDDALRFAELRGVRAMIETYPLEKAAEAYARMMSGNAEFRVVLTM